MVNRREFFGLLALPFVAPLLPKQRPRIKWTGFPASSELQQQLLKLTEALIKSQKKIEEVAAKTDRQILLIRSVVEKFNNGIS